MSLLLSYGIDHHILNLLTIVGLVLGVLGSFYLTYDLLGGPLRLFTRAVIFGSLVGIATTAGQFTVGEAPCLIGTCGDFDVGPAFGNAFAFGLSCALVASFLALTRLAHPSATKPRFFTSRFGTKLMIISGSAFILVFVLLAIILAQFFTSLQNQEPGKTLSNILASANPILLTLGFLFWIVGILIAVAPWIGWQVNQFTKEQLGGIGVLLVLIGFLVQLLQPLAVALNIPMN